MSDLDGEALTEADKAKTLQAKQESKREGTLNLRAVSSDKRWREKCQAGQ